MLDGFLGRLLRVFAPVETALQIELVSFVALCVLLVQPFLFARDFEFEFVDNLSRNLTLQQQEVC